MWIDERRVQWLKYLTEVLARATSCTIPSARLLQIHMTRLSARHGLSDESGLPLMRRSDKWSLEHSFISARMCRTATSHCTWAQVCYTTNSHTRQGVF